MDKQPGMLSVKPDNSVEDAFKAILYRNLARVKKWEPVAVTGTDIEGVHQVRVGLRRMRSALTVFQPVIPRKTSKPLAREMRWAAKELDLARDLDVYIAENFSEKNLSGSKRTLLKIATRHRKMAYRQVNDLIQSERYEHLQRRLVDWLESKTWRDACSSEETGMLDSDVTPFAARVLQRHRHRVLKHGKNIHKLSDAELHQLRIECKKLRYATEFFSPLYGGSMTSFTRHLKTLQDILGVLHDCAVMRDLQGILLEDNQDPKIRYAAEKLEKQRMRDAKAKKKLLKKRWDSFIRVKRPWRSYV